MAETMRDHLVRKLTDSFECMGRVFDAGQAEWLADTALDTLTEPTVGMVEAFWSVDIDNLGEPYSGPEPRVAWQAMIRAAKEGK